MTIKELADLCGTHKTGIRRTIDRLGLSGQLQKDENGVVQIPKHIVEQVTAQYQDTAETPQDTQEQKAEQCQNPTEQALLAALDALREQLAAKDRQLDAKDQQLAAQQHTIDTLTAALSNAQALHAGTIQQQLTAARVDNRPEPEEPAADQEEPQPQPEGAETARTSGNVEGKETTPPQQETQEQPHKTAFRFPFFKRPAKRE